MQCAFLLFHPIEGEGGGCSAAGAALIVQLFALLPDKGGILFPKRIPPLEPPEKGEGRPPRPPTLRALGLKDCTRCAVEVQCTWLRHGSSASRYRQQPRPTSWGACDGGSAADCGAYRRHCFARRRWGVPFYYKKTTASAVVFLFLQVIQSRADSGNNKCRKRTILAADHLFDFFKHIVGKAYRFTRRRRYARNLKGHSSHLQYNLYDKCIA